MMLGQISLEKVVEYISFPGQLQDKTVLYILRNFAEMFNY